MQKLINNGASGGYYRALDAHQAFEVPLALHVTPTFASAVQWATSASLGPDDGPAFNTRIGSLIGDGTIDLLGSTFSDHLLPYFNTAFNTDNISLARDFLTNIYGHLPSPSVSLDAGARFQLRRSAKGRRRRLRLHVCRPNAARLEVVRPHFRARRRRLSHQPDQRARTPSSSTTARAVTSSRATTTARPSSRASSSAARPAPPRRTRSSFS